MDERGIALWGFMGSGKSTVGAALAVRRGWDHVDLDEVLVRRFGPIAAQFAAVGESGFRERERAALRDYCDGTARVLSLGGGTPVLPGNRAMIAAAYLSVFLDAPWAVLQERIAAQAGGARLRPLWGDDARGRYLARRPAYLAADRVVDTTGCTVEGVVSAIEEVVCNG